ncbi:hypothetical protein BGW36DRAFT_289358 [Talaromyces proteolyticus]|uniref:MFS general substrate transporter n=1 Tax=Talaromyces proteolyticus TaxID=1131652 RepID=A0AAD4KXV1_9EURO|nr:uncharacterized protein BGW36DRAFT_289358 [Talaromyces proteolyticus]KAH8701808.1 hypothetical protein BGW36DRAFT_289358 [Talaromyces proteolyticus]
MAIKIPGLPLVRLHSPYWQNVIMGLIVAMTAGLYEALNLLGAGGGRPNSAQTVQVVNATLCAVWVLSSTFSGSLLNTIGPALTACLGVVGYMIYIGSLWYFDKTGHEGFPIFAAVAIGISAGCLFCTMGYISMSYSEERERGSFIALSFNLQAFGAAVGGIIPLLINRKSSKAAGVPEVVYIVFIVIQGFACLFAFALRPPSKITREDGTQLANIKSRGFVEELKSTLEIFRDWKLLIMIPAFLPSECFLVYAGSVNAFHNSLRARSLLSFIAVVVQIPAGIGLQKILDHDKWSRRTRAIVGLVVIGVPLIAAWTWEVVRTRHYNRSQPPTNPTDWNEDAFIPIFFLFVLNWVSSVLWPYLILYFLGCLTNSPRKSANYAGIFRAMQGAGEAICFGVDSIEVPYIKEAGVLLAFYTAGVIIFGYLAVFHISETQYFAGEEGVVLPKRVLDGHEIDEDRHVDPDSKVATEGKSGSTP